MTKAKSSPAIDAVREQRVRDSAVTLSTGVQARFVSVAASLIDKVTSRIVDPDIPRQFIEKKGREEENPFDPDYIKTIRENEVKRNKVALDTLILFGVDLVDGVPEDSLWMPKLKYLEKLGHIDLSEYDLEDEYEREFVYKQFIAVGSDDIVEVLRRSGISEEDIAQAAKSFRSDEERNAD